MMVKRFLRYNSRHRLYWGDKGLELNPIMSSSHRKDGRRTKSWDEPLWLFRLRQRWFAFAGKQRCGRRGESWMGAQNTEELPDTWDLGPDGFRTCSYCGSIHFEDLLEICRRTLLDERYGVEGTTKAYKVYVKQPGVRNASEGAIKYYKQHSPEYVSVKDSELFSQACAISAKRFEERMASWKTDQATRSA